MLVVWQVRLMKLAEILGAMGVVIGVAIFLILSIRYLLTSEALKHFTATDGRVLLNYFTIAVSACETSPGPLPDPTVDAFQAVMGTPSWALGASVLVLSGVPFSQRTRSHLYLLGHTSVRCGLRLWDVFFFSMDGCRSLFW